MGYSFIENQKQENSTNRSKSVASFLPVDPEWTLDQIVFSNSLKEQLSDIVSFCKNKEKIINDWELYRFFVEKSQGFGADKIRTDLGLRLIFARLMSFAFRHFPL